MVKSNWLSRKFRKFTIHWPLKSNKLPTQLKSQRCSYQTILSVSAWTCWQSQKLQRTFKMYSKLYTKLRICALTRLPRRWTQPDTFISRPRRHSVSSRGICFPSQSTCCKIPQSSLSIAPWRVRESDRCKGRSLNYHQSFRVSRVNWRKSSRSFLTWKILESGVTLIWPEWFSMTKRSYSKTTRTWVSSCQQSSRSCGAWSNW